MKLSTKSRYGLNVMYFLAKNYNDELQSTEDIRLYTSVSIKYLEKILSCLKSHNLVVSVRGVNGGYKLINSPKIITIGQILRALEDNLEFVNSINDDNINTPAKNVYKKLYKSINQTLDGISLKDMIDDNIGEYNG